ncbi:MAG: hypothetical protein NVS2B7_38950 [Herpetosiphon sp.]
MLGMTISFLGMYVFLLGFLPPLANSLGGLLLGGAVFTGGLQVIIWLREGSSFVGAVGRMILTAISVVAIMGGFVWYLGTYLPNQPGLFHFGMAAMPKASDAAPNLLSRLMVPAAIPAATTPSPLVVPVSGAVAPTTNDICGTAIVVTVDALAIHPTPLLQSPQSGATAKGQSVDLLCTAPVNADQRVWRQVRDGRVIGWMSTRYLQIVSGR